MDLARLKPLQDQLEHHSVYQAVGDLKSLRTFMEHHVFCVWDFMSLLKALQQELAPAGAPWFPDSTGGVRRLINEIVLAEESDEAPGLGSKRLFISHFEMYVQAMSEVGANVLPINTFLEDVKEKGVKAALLTKTIPTPARIFVEDTFGIIGTHKPHILAAVFFSGTRKCYSRNVSFFTARHGYQRGISSNVSLLSQSPHPSGRRGALAYGIGNVGIALQRKCSA